jgi:hypothetical protein
LAGAAFLEKTNFIATVIKSPIAAATKIEFCIPMNCKRTNPQITVPKTAPKEFMKYTPDIFFSGEFSFVSPTITGNDAPISVAGNPTATIVNKSCGKNPINPSVNGRPAANLK